MKLIVFCGPKGSGKDTAARYLLNQNPPPPNVGMSGMKIPPPLFQKLNFADPLKTSCGLIFGLTDAEMNDPGLKERVLDRWPFKTPRELMQNVAHLFRTMYAPDIWVRAWERRLRDTHSRCIVVTDLRHQEELDLLTKLGAQIFYIDNPVVEAARAQGIERGEKLWTDPSEAMAPVLKSIATAVIPNSGTLDELAAATLLAAKGTAGDWTTWNPQ